jgi:hypothetical protein
MLLFRSGEHAERWTEHRGASHGAFLTLEQQWSSRAHGSRGGSTPTPAAHRRGGVQAVFERIGLTGPFWSLTG